VRVVAVASESHDGAERDEHDADMEVDEEDGDEAHRFADLTAAPPPRRATSDNYDGRNQADRDDQVEDFDGASHSDVSGSSARTGSHKVGPVVPATGRRPRSHRIGVREVVAGPWTTTAARSGGTGVTSVIRISLVGGGFTPLLSPRLIVL
jgi:hypothetical protein